MAPAAEKSAQPYRRHIVGLPLQRSVFREAARAATTIGLPDLSSELDFPARLDENGDLFLDRSKVAALTKALLSWFTPATLGLMRSTHAAACDASVQPARGRPGRRTPRQANLTLIRKPEKPKRSPLLNLKLTHKKYQSWKTFLDNAYWSVELK